MIAKLRNRFYLFFIFTLLATSATIKIQAQETPDTFNNPILPGYHPDPSICRVGEDYYLVNSTFVWFPGLPIYHSKDLVNWELIGHAIDRSNMVDFDGLPDKLGLFAPTIRYNNGTFYIINTCVGCGMNFYITAANPAGPWSEPIWLTEIPGIDPSLFWDDDGRCYYTGTDRTKKQEWLNQTKVFNQEINLEKQKIIGDQHVLTYGHANNARYTEGPHIYKINGKYLLMVSEGGTEINHALSIHHSNNINGPYISDYVNPALSHRHLGKDYPLHAIGHGDFVQLPNGDWWCVVLGKRCIDEATTLGRETFLARVEFQGQTPIFNPGYGKVLMRQERPNLPWTPFANPLERDLFDTDQLNLMWCTIRTPKEEFYSLEKGVLNLCLRKEVMDSMVNSSILLQRIKHHRFEAKTKLEFKTKKQEEQAGLVIYRTNQNHYSLLKNNNSLTLYRSFKGEKTKIASVPYKNNEVVLMASANDLEIQFSYGETEYSMQSIGKKQSLIVIADGNGNQFNGPGVGIYATSNGTKTKSKAAFNWFEYKANNR